MPPLQYRQPLFVGSESKFQLNSAIQEGLLRIYTQNKENKRRSCANTSSHTHKKNIHMKQKDEREKKNKRENERKMKKTREKWKRHRSIKSQY